MINKSLKWSAAHQVRGFLILIFGFTGVFLLNFVFFAVGHGRMWRRLPDDHPAAHKALEANAGTSYNISKVMWNFFINNFDSSK